MESVKIEADNSISVEETKEKAKKRKPKVSKKRCKVICSTKSYSIVDFEGYGVKIKKTNKEFVVVKYIGTIGKNNFKIVE